MIAAIGFCAHTGDVRTKMPGTVAATFALLFLAGCTATPEPAESETPEREVEAAAQASEDFSPIVGEVLAEPAPYPATDGQVHLAYEVLLSNVLSQDVELDSIAVEADGETLLELGGDELAEWLRIYGGQSGGTTLGPGQRALVWLDVTVPTMDDVPTSLSHVLAISPTQEIPPVVSTSMTLSLAPTSVSTVEAVVISPPVKGDRWLDGNSCCGVTPHRAAINPINGALHAPERYAIDYVRLDEENRIFDGPVDDISSYGYVGEKILAVADGPIVAIVSDLPDQKPGANPTGLSVGEYGGNHVVQEIGDGRFAFYAHLQPDNPLGLAVGQQMSRGDAVGLLGNSGNTDAPHLHFHVMDSPLPLASNGVPFVFEKFTVDGFVSFEDVISCTEEGGSCAVDTGDAGERTDEGPLTGTLMTYQ